MDKPSFSMNNRNGYTCRAGIFRGPIARGPIGRQNMPAVTVAPSISNAKNNTSSGIGTLHSFTFCLQLNRYTRVSCCVTAGVCHRPIVTVF